MTGISGMTLKSGERDFIASCGIGGVLLFSKNFDTPVQLAELIHSIQKLGRGELLIAVDQEGGRVVRFKSPFTVLPAMEEFSRHHSPELCRQAFEIVGKELSSSGINLNLAPVCDIVNNRDNQVIGDRSFGQRAEEVSPFIPTVIEGMKSHGVLSCAKHFPGHGAVSCDSHDSLPVVEIGIEELRKQEFVPFIKAVESGVDLVMMAHLKVSSIDRELPTSLSPKAYEMLREELSFQGVIITDDMQMGAITRHFDGEDAAVRAIGAGADIIEYRQMEKAQKAYHALERALESGRLEESMIEEKVLRIRNLKKTMVTQTISTQKASKTVGAKAHQDFLRRLKKHI